MKGIPVRSNGDPVRRTFVFAGTYTQFGHWCMYSRVNPCSRMVRCLSSPWDIRGYRDFDLVYTGTYYDHRDWSLITVELSYYSALGEIGQTYDQFESCEIEPYIVDGGTGCS